MTQSRAIPASVQAELELPSSADALLAFLTIEHDALAEPIRVVSDVLDYIKGGLTFTGLPFEIQVVTDDEQTPKTQLRFENVDRRIGQAVRALNSRARVALEVCTSADFDLSVDPRTESGTAAMVYSFAHFELQDVTVTAIDITGTVILRDFSQEPFPKMRATQKRLPGSWR